MFGETVPRSCSGTWPMGGETGIETEVSLPEPSLASSSELISSNSTDRCCLGVLEMKYVFGIFVIYYKNLMSKFIVNIRF